jgi:hypothetical protein
VRSIEAAAETAASQLSELISSESAEAAIAG